MSDQCLDSLDLFLPEYPDSDQPGIQTLVSNYKEFRELYSTKIEPLPLKNKFYRHQELVQRFVEAGITPNVIIHKTGTGKTPTILGVIKKYMDHPTINSFYIVSPNDTVRDNTKKEIEKIFSDLIQIDQTKIRNKKQKQGKRKLTMRIKSLNIYMFTFDSFAKEFFQTQEEEITKKIRKKEDMRIRNNIMQEQRKKGDKVTTKGYKTREEKKEVDKLLRIQSEERLNQVASRYDGSIIIIDEVDQIIPTISEGKYMLKNSNDPNDLDFEEGQYFLSPEVEIGGLYRLEKNTKLNHVEKKMNYVKFFEILQRVKRCIKFLLTATPIRESPDEFSLIMNLVNPKDKLLPVYDIVEVPDLEMEYYLRGKISYVDTLEVGVIKNYIGEKLFNIKNKIYDKYIIYGTEMSIYQSLVYLMLQNSKQKTPFFQDLIQTSNFLYNNTELSKIYEDQIVPLNFDLLSEGFGTKASKLYLTDGSDKTENVNVYDLKFRNRISFNNNNIKNNMAEYLKPYDKDLTDAAIGCIKYLLYTKSKNATNNDNRFYKQNVEESETIISENQKYANYFEGHAENNVRTLPIIELAKTLVQRTIHREKTLSYIYQYSSKCHAVALRCLTDQGQTVTHYSLVHGSGALIFGLCMKALGFELYKPISNNKVVRSKIIDGRTTSELLLDIRKKPRYCLLVGDNSNDHSSIIDVRNTYDNRYGDYIKLTIASQVAGVGLTYKNTINAFLFETDFNSRFQEQSLGRNYRSGSHDDVLYDLKMNTNLTPEFKLNIYLLSNRINSKIFDYLFKNKDLVGFENTDFRNTVDKNSKNYVEFESFDNKLSNVINYSILANLKNIKDQYNSKQLINIFNIDINNDEDTIDDKMYKTNIEKDVINEKVHTAIRRSAIDSQIHIKRNTKRYLETSFDPPPLIDWRSDALKLVNQVKDFYQINGYLNEDNIILMNELLLLFSIDPSENNEILMEKINNLIRYIIGLTQIPDNFAEELSNRSANPLLGTEYETYLDFILETTELLKINYSNKIKTKIIDRINTIINLGNPNSYAAKTANQLYKTFNDLIDEYEDNEENMNRNSFIKLCNKYQIYPLTEENNKNYIALFYQKEEKIIMDNIYKIFETETKFDINELYQNLSHLSPELINKTVNKMIYGNYIIKDRFGRDNIINMDNNIIYITHNIFEKPHSNKHYNQSDKLIGFLNINENNVLFESQIDISNKLIDDMRKYTNPIDYINSFNINHIAQVVERLVYNKINNIKSSIPESTVNEIIYYFRNYLFEINEPEQEISELVKKRIEITRLNGVVSFKKNAEDIKLSGEKVYLLTIRSLFRDNGKYTPVVDIFNMNKSIKIFKPSENSYWRDLTEDEKLIYPVIIKDINMTKLKQFEDEIGVPVYGLKIKVGSFIDELYIKYNIESQMLETKKSGKEIDRRTIKRGGNINNMNSEFQSILNQLGEPAPNESPDYQKSLIIEILEEDDLIYYV